MTKPTPRERMSQKRRHHIFSERCTGHNVAPCITCGRPIHRHNDRWIIEHERALGLLGPDTNPNCGPAHYECGLEKTAQQDLPRIAKAKRQEALSLDMPKQMGKRSFWAPSRQPREVRKAALPPHFLYAPAAREARGET